MIFIHVQKEKIHLESEINKLYFNHHNVGAVVTFLGIVREFIDESSHVNSLKGIELEYYPGMTEKFLREIALEVQNRWNIAHISMIHRVGFLFINEPVVWVGVSSAHRHASFEACHFLIDQLKVNAPFWKKEVMLSGESQWVQAKEHDFLSTKKWNISCNISCV